MTKETKPENHGDLAEEKTIPADSLACENMESPVFIVPKPPIPGRTGWSIVPW